MVSTNKLFLKIRLLCFVFQEKLDEKKEVVSKLTYQLEAALADARRQAESQREKALAKVWCSSQCSPVNSIKTGTIPP